MTEGGIRRSLNQKAKKIEKSKFNNMSDEFDEDEDYNDSADNRNKNNEDSTIEDDENEEAEEYYEEIDPDWLPGSTKVRHLQIYNHKNKSFKNNDYIRLLHKFLIICVYIDDLTAAKLLCDSFMTNPFARLVNGHSPFLFSISLGRINFLKYFLGQNYVFQDSSQKINLPKLLNKCEKKGYNNALHLAISKNRAEMMELLLEKGIKFTSVNYMNWKPFEMSKKKVFMKHKKELVTSLEEKEIIADPSLLNPEIVPKSLYGT